MKTITSLDKTQYIAISVMLQFIFLLWGKWGVRLQGLLCVLWRATTTQLFIKLQQEFITMCHFCMADDVQSVVNMLIQ